MILIENLLGELIGQFFFMGAKGFTGIENPDKFCLNNSILKRGKLPVFGIERMKFFTFDRF